MTHLDAVTLLLLPPADRVQYELAEADAYFHDLFGRDETAWLPSERALYVTAIAAITSGGPEPAEAVAA